VKTIKCLKRRIETMNYLNVQEVLSETFLNTNLHGEDPPENW
jgi:hypothetical protein